jgi:hypothetical protein
VHTSNGTTATRNGAPADGAKPKVAAKKNAAAAARSNR